MFGISEKYKLNKKLSVSSILVSNMDSKDRKKLKEILKNIVLSYQIVGEEIPSVITEEYNCQVIMILDIEIDNIKNANYAGKILQNYIKPLCIIRFYDISNECYSFGQKRLNKTDNSEIVVDSYFITKNRSIFYSDNVKIKYDKYLDINNVKNLSDKNTVYMELMTKAYLIDNENLFDFIDEILESNIWYEYDKCIYILKTFYKFHLLKNEIRKQKETNIKVQINKQIKQCLDKVKEMLV